MLAQCPSARLAGLSLQLERNAQLTFRIKARSTSAASRRTATTRPPTRPATICSSTRNSNDPFLVTGTSQSCHHLRWEQRFRELAEFSAAVGHCQVPARYGDNPKLGHWLRTQRLEYAQGTLSPERAARLRSLGVRWGKRQKQRRSSGWYRRLSEIREFHKQHGHSHVPRSMAKLSDWANLQRKHWREGKLTANQVKCLNCLDFQWDLPTYHVTREDRWNENYEVLQAYAAKHGNCNVPQRYAPNESLGIWVHTQRRAYAEGKLSTPRKARLDELAFEWGEVPVSPPPEPAASGSQEMGFEASLRPQQAGDPPRPRKVKSTAAQLEWDKRLEEMKSYKARHGHCHVPERDRKNPVLARWVTDQRLLFSQGKLPSDLIQRLEQVGLSLSGVSDGEWLGWFRRLEGLIAAHNGACGLHTISAEDEALGRWVQQQRRLKRRRLLLPHRESSLQALDVDILGDGCLESYSEIWEHRYAELEAHALLHGFGPSIMRAPLRTWVIAQRKSYKKGTLSSYRVHLLEELHFEWIPTWDTQYSELVRYWLLHGDCLVPQHFDQNPQLGTWVRTQRRSRKHGTLCVERLQKLDALGFSWGACCAEDDEHWDRHCAELAAFRAESGADAQPAPGSSLARWLEAQIHEQRMGRLVTRRQEQLETLGVECDGTRCMAQDVYDSQWEQGFEKMRDYRLETGSCEVSTTRPVDPQLLLWMHNQIQLRASGCLHPSRARRLDALGFPWKIVRSCSTASTPPVGAGPPSKASLKTLKTSVPTGSWAPGASWWDMYHLLAKFREKHGHCSVPEEAEPRLASWVARQRALYQEGGLLPERAAALSCLGFSFLAAASQRPQRTLADVWEARFQELLCFHAKEGHCNVPSSSCVLLEWTNMQRFLRARGSLSPGQVKRLEALGFSWGADFDMQQRPPALSAPSRSRPRNRPTGGAATWEEFFQELSEFRAKTGHCRLTGTAEASQARSELVSWLRLQVFRYEAGTLPESLAHRLTALNLEWGHFAWEESYQELCSYLREHGDCMVSEDSPQHKQLYRWAEEQRAAMRSGLLHEDQISKLDRLGFFWGS
mmetsp:Transcript_4747/g.13168  ORF Transcript_4747/g.13168 Transcript_4747/m.13168 type:complete len:1067 (-) Transcript_4747:263-3463(-)